MSSLRKITLACVIVAASALPSIARAQAGLPNQDTYFRFSAPVEVPGATLPAGRYLFVLADSQSNRHLVRVMSEDRKKLFATVMAIPSYSVAKPSDEPEIRFMESPENSPHAVKLWIYPGRTVGHEFLYPRGQAMRLARTTGEPVLTTKTESSATETVADTEMTRVDRDGHDAAVTADTREIDAKLEAERGTRANAPEAQAQAQPAPAPERAPAPAATPSTAATRTELPRTATFFPAIALMGAGSLGAHFWMRFFRRQRVLPPSRG